MNAPSLKSVTERFAALTLIYWANPSKAVNECGTASAHFKRWLEAHDFRAEIVQLLGKPAFVCEARENRGDPLLDGELECHIVVCCEGDYYDWTRRQYDDRADYPHVCSRAELEAEGWFVTHRGQRRDDDEP